MGIYDTGDGIYGEYAYRHSLEDEINKLRKTVAARNKTIGELRKENKALKAQLKGL